MVRSTITDVFTPTFNPINTIPTLDMQRILLNKELEALTHNYWIDGNDRERCSFDDAEPSTNSAVNDEAK